MAHESPVVDNVTVAILDGSEIDWQSAEALADPQDRDLLEPLRLIAAIATVHRAPTRGDGPLWGHLRLLEQVGSGSFGQVFRAWDTRLDREVALKLLPVGPSSNVALSDAILREGKLLAKVRHPNVVTIYGAEHIGARIGLWMEFVRGETLEQKLARVGPLPPTEVIAIGLELSRALSAVHAVGLLHRDVKAQNVVCAADGRIVLMDFGAGRELDDRSRSDLTGTPLYLAPEVLGGRPATVVSDVYSLGVLLYHLATGTYPVDGTSLDDLRFSHMRYQHRRVRSVRPAVPAALAQSIERAIEIDPTRRYSSADAVTRELIALQQRGRRLSAGALIISAGVVVVALAAGFRFGIVPDLTPRTWRLGASRATASVTEANPVIAVLPFKSINSSAETVRLVDSLTAGLIQQLGAIDGLRVIFQQSSFMLRDKPQALSAVGKQLGVNLVVTGDVEFANGVLVIHAALQPVVGGEALWRDSLTRRVQSAGDLTDLLTELTRTIVNRLRLRLGPTQRRYTTDILTYETYLRARELRDKRLGKAREALPLFAEVIRRDPEYAPAYAALAATYGDLTMSWPNAGDFALAPAEAIARMVPLTAKAIEIDPMLAEAHVSSAYMHALERRWVDAEAAFRHALALDPTITAVYGDFVLSTLEPWGRLDESLKTLHMALAADPLSLDLRNVMARIQLSAGLYDEALTNCEYVIAQDPDFPFAEEYYARALAVTGRTDQALALFSKRRDLNEHGIAYVYAMTGRRTEAEQIAARSARFPNRQALIYAALGDKDRAFAALDRLAALNPRRAGAYLYYPELSALRGDPRAELLRRRLGFPP